MVVVGVYWRFDAGSAAVLDYGLLHEVVGLLGCSRVSLISKDAKCID